MQSRRISLNAPAPLRMAIAFVLIVLLASCSSKDPDTQTPVAITSEVPPTGTAQPTATTSTTPPPTGTAVTPPATVSQPNESIVGVIPVPPERDLYELARRLTLKTSQPVPRFASPSPGPLEAGQRVEWRVSREIGTVTIDAEVRHVTEHAYWVFEDGFIPDQGRLEQAAEQFEAAVWPNVVGALGDVWNPGVDGDPRIVIFHGSLRPGVAGYFSGLDEYPVQIQPDSNQREAIYVAADALTLGGTAYMSTVAHELQHAIHWAADPGEESWINEGISEVAADLAGFAPGSISSFLVRPNTSLLQWEPEIFQASPNYGAAALFFEYISVRYGGVETLRKIVEHPADGIASLDAVFSGAGYPVTTIDVFADWVVANLVDDDTGAFSYPSRQIRLPRTTFVPLTQTIQDSVQPFGTNYYRLEEPGERVDVSFRGNPSGRVFPAEPHSGETCWWTNSGDSIDTTLTRSVDLRGVDSATFEFWSWLAIEEDWDYAYIEVSTDAGSTWHILPSGATKSSNPNGTAFGPGLTGSSGGWVKDAVDLSEFAGSEVLLRIEYITDDAIHGRGACFDDFSIPEIGWSDSTDALNGWTTEGFALINDRVPVDYMVQIIRDQESGPSVVERVSVDASGAAELAIRDIASTETISIAVSVVTPDASGSLDYAINFNSR